MGKNQFQETKDRFMAATCFVRYPLTYDVWMSLVDELKAAALFVNFYPQVIVAWQKWDKLCYLEEEDAVGTVIQYIVKNVDKIKADRKRFTPNYIYTVAYNALTGFCRVAGRQWYYATFQSNTFDLDDGEHDMFDIIEDTVDCFRSSRFRKVISSMNDTQKAIISHLIWNTKLEKTERKSEKAIMEQLREVFKEYLVDDNIDEVQPDPQDKKITFSDVYAMDDEISSAVCVMSDGEQAVYYGEKQITHDTKKVSIVFFGASKDYIVPLDIAKNLEVTDIECYK